VLGDGVEVLAELVGQQPAISEGAQRVATEDVRPSPADLDDAVTHEDPPAELLQDQIFADDRNQTDRTHPRAGVVTVAGVPERVDRVGGVADDRYQPDRVERGVSRIADRRRPDARLPEPPGLGRVDAGRRYRRRRDVARPGDRRSGPFQQLQRPSAQRVGGVGGDRVG